MDKTDLQILLRRSRPFHLLTVIIAYALGVGIVHYLGQPIHPGNYFLGQAWITALQLGSYYLGEYLGTPAELGILNRLPYGQPREDDLEGLSKEIALYTSVIFFALAAALTALLGLSGTLNMPLALLMTIIFLGFVIDFIPGLNLADSAYLELITTLLLIILTPAFGVLVQSGELHRLLAISTFPLAALHLAMLIALQFPAYGSNMAQHKKTLLTRLDWRLGIQFHNLLIIIAFLLIGLSALFGFPPDMLLPIFLALPFGAYQVWHLNRISQGAPTRWKVLSLNAIITFGFTAYLFTYMFWTR
ncbi:MAG: hypothetical protein MAG431_02395 [Chloroflexi bacterium]|nr:hypothetical protein [Chloroflexota bacterium]